MEPKAVLKQYFGYDAFRPGQEQLIAALLSGRDALGVMPTGAGKSVCYQVPAMLLPGVTIVLSPLISLMKDQVAAMAQAGIPAAFLNSTLSGDEYRQVLRQAHIGAYKLLYVAPERLTAPAFLHLTESVPVSLIAVDEAHCVSQWGQDFRPSYLKIMEFIQRLPYRPTVGAFTATATAAVREDVVRILGLRDPLCVTTGFDRANLFFDVMAPKSKDACLMTLLRQRKGKSGIIYCATRAKVEKVCQDLCARGFAATRYHAGLDGEERRQNQEDFVYDRRPIMVATNAFGMGIDKSSVSFVIHYNMPKDLESYYQEAGRAGRDGERADCILLHSPGDIQTAKYMIGLDSENESLSEEEREVIRRRDLERLGQMIGYCKSEGCLRAYILRYFGETAPENCGNCGNCNGVYIQQDITTAAQKILSCVARVERLGRFSLGAALYVQILRGSRNQRIFQLELDKLPTYGILADADQRTVRAYLDALLQQGYLRTADGEFPTIHLTGAAGAVLFHGQTVAIAVRQQPVEVKPPKKRKRRQPAPPPDPEQFVEPELDLLGQLKTLRYQLAQEANVPAYVIFSNATLNAMAERKPTTTAEFLDLPGVGEKKAFRYSKPFLDLIANFVG